MLSIGSNCSENVLPLGCGLNVSRDSVNKLLAVFRTDPSLFFLFKKLQDTVRNSTESEHR